MDLYNKTNQIAFKLFSEMTETKSKDYLVLEDDEGGEQTGKSSTPRKLQLEFIKEMKGQFKQGEVVDVVKEGSSFNVFRRGIDGANPVKLNEKQAEEFFGQALKEALWDDIKGAAKKTASKVGKKVLSGVAGAASGATEALKAGANLKTALQGAIASGKKAIADEGLRQQFESARDKIVGIVKSLGGKITGLNDEKIKASIETALTILAAGKTFKLGESPKAAPVEAGEAKPGSGGGPRGEPEFEEEIEEESSVKNKLPKGVPQAKFIDKNALKPKKAKTIGPFRKGKAGSGESLPKD